MISSPTEKGVVMIGGIGYSSDLLELSGDSIETLEWKILEQKLQHPRYQHVSFSISNDIAATLTIYDICRRQNGKRQMPRQQICRRQIHDGKWRQMIEKNSPKFVRKRAKNGPIFGQK